MKIEATDSKTGEKKPITINFPGWSIPFLVLSIPLMVIAVIATFVFIFGFVLIAIPVVLLIIGVCFGVIKLISYFG